MLIIIQIHKLDISNYPDCEENVTTWSLGHVLLPQKSSRVSVHDFLSSGSHRLIDSKAQRPSTTYNIATYQ